MQSSTLKFLFSFLIYFDIASLRNASTTTLLMLKVDQCLLSLTCECVHDNAQQCTGFRNFIMLKLSNAHSNFWSLFSFLIYTWVVKLSRHTHWWSLPHSRPPQTTRQVYRAAALCPPDPALAWWRVLVPRINCSEVLWQYDFLPLLLCAKEITEGNNAVMLCLLFNAGLWKNCAMWGVCVSNRTSLVTPNCGCLKSHTSLHPLSSLLIPFVMFCQLCFIYVPNTILELQVYFNFPSGDFVNSCTCTQQTKDCHAFSTCA